VSRCIVWVHFRRSSRRNGCRRHYIFRKTSRSFFPPQPSPRITTADFCASPGERGETSSIGVLYNRFSQPQRPCLFLYHDLFFGGHSFQGLSSTIQEIVKESCIPRRNNLPSIAYSGFSIPGPCRFCLGTAFTYHMNGSVEKSRQRRSRHFSVLTYYPYAPRTIMAAALLNELF